MSNLPIYKGAWDRATDTTRTLVRRLGSRGIYPISVEITSAGPTIHLTEADFAAYIAEQRTRCAGILPVEAKSLGSAGLPTSYEQVSLDLGTARLVCHRRVA